MKIKCNICELDSDYIFSSVVLSKYNVSFFQCKKCGYIQTEEPYWIEEAYSRSINLSDTGYLVRNIHYAQKLTVFLNFFFKKELKTDHGQARFIDYAGGYGVFVRMMRDVGFDYYWADKYTKNIFAGGFAGDLTAHYTAMTLFDCFEHFVHPIVELENILPLSDNIIFSTDIVSNPAPQPNEWWYYGFEHGQHVSFYTKQSLEFIAKKYNFYFRSMGSLHFLTKKKVPLWLIILLKSTRFGIQKLFSKNLKSKMWADHEYCKRICE